MADGNFRLGEKQEHKYRIIKCNRIIQMAKLSFLISLNKDVKFFIKTKFKFNSPGKQICPYTQKGKKNT